MKIELSERDVQIIKIALSYMRSNVDDVNEATDDKHQFTEDEVFKVFSVFEVWSLVESYNAGASK